MMSIHRIDSRLVLFLLAFFAVQIAAAAELKTQRPAKPPSPPNERPTNRPVLQDDREPLPVIKSPVENASLSKNDPVDALLKSLNSPEIRRAIHEIALENIPHKYEDAKKWGLQKEIVSGLDVKLRGLELRMKRRRKRVNHGSWKKYNIQLVDPQKKFDLRVQNFRSPQPGHISFRAIADTPLKVTARIQEWNRGVRIFSVTMEARARVHLVADCDVESEIVAATFPPEIQLKPKVHSADIRVSQFQLERVSHVKGTLAKETGRNLRGLIDREIAKKRRQLPAKINRQIAKKEDKLRISFGVKLRKVGASLICLVVERTMMPAI